MSKRLLVSLIVIALAVAVIGAGTYAYFSDTETSAANHFTAGSLDLKVNGTDSPANLNAAFDSKINNLKPGDDFTMDVPVGNAGTVAGTASLKFSGLAETAGGAGLEPGLTNSSKDLADNLKVEVLYDGVSVKTDTLKNLDGVVITAPAALAGGGSATWTLHCSIGTNVANEIMGDTATADMVYGLDQVH
jgi:spore coat-associated protein N